MPLNAPRRCRQTLVKPARYPRLWTETSLGLAQASKRHDLVAGVVADVGAAEIADAGLAAPMLDDLDLGLAEIRIVVRNGAAAAEPDAGDAPDRRIAGDVEQRAVDPVHVFRHFLEHQHMAGKVRLQRR